MNDPTMARVIAQIAFIGYPDNLSHTTRVVEQARRSAVALQDKDSGEGDWQKWIDAVVSAAWLHDVIEDTNIGFEVLGEHYDGVVIAALDLLTRQDSYSYWDYIERMMSAKGAGADLARFIKAIDAEDNRWRSVGQPKRQARYTRVLEMLSATQPLPPGPNRIIGGKKEVEK